MTRFTVLPILIIGFFGCSTQRAVMPNAGYISPASALQTKELELSQQAALDAEKSAKEASSESEKVQSQIAELKSQVEKLSVLASGCSDIAKKSDQKRAAAAAARAKKEAQEKKAVEESAAVALPQPTSNPIKFAFGFLLACSIKCFPEPEPNSRYVST